jgi:hypothetical protein
VDQSAALCDILGCTPNDLIEIEMVNTAVRKTAGTSATAAPVARRVTVKRPGAS